MTEEGGHTLQGGSAHPAKNAKVQGKQATTQPTMLVQPRGESPGGEKSWEEESRKSAADTYCGKRKNCHPGPTEPQKNWRNHEVLKKKAGVERRKSGVASEQTR